jgi:hypothetical protein
MSPSTAPQDKRCPILADSTTTEQLARRVQALEAENERIRAAASEDLQNWMMKYTVLMRENTCLKTQLEKQETDEPEHDDVRDLLLIWKDATGRGNKADIGAGSKRYGLAKAGLIRWGKQRCEHALRGLGLQPYAGPRGRSNEQYPGAKKFADVEHALGDEVRMEKLEALWLAHERPSLLDPPVPEPPRVEVLEPVREHRPGLFAGPYRRPDELPPIDRVLNALADRGLTVRAHPGDPDSWSAQCPAHDDRDPSLSVHRRHDGVVGLHCFGPCPTEVVIAALDLEWGDLWEDSERDANRGDGVPVVRAVPGHLQQAMRQLLARSESRAA